MGCSYSLALCGAGGLLDAAATDPAAPPATDPLVAIPDTCDVRVDYRVLECVGKGSFGSVYRAVNRVTGRVVAIKSVARASVKAASIYREWSVLESVGSHPYCVAYHGTFKTPTSVDFVLEYLPGGELFERLISCGPLPEAAVRPAVAHLADALAYLHGRGIVHR